MLSPTDFDPTTSVSVKLIHNDGKVVIESPLEDELKKSVAEKRAQSGHPYVGFVQKMVMSPFPVEREGRINAEATIGDRTMVCASLNIRKAPEQKAK